MNTNAPEQHNSLVDLGESRNVKIPGRLAVQHIILDERLQSRELKPTVTKDYAAAMRRGVVFPAVLVVRDANDHYYLVDGHHRVAATKQLIGIDDITVEIVAGDFTDALWLSWGANRENGLPRTRDAKRRAIRAALQHTKWSKESDRKIGEHIGCDHKTVAAMRRSIRGEFPTVAEEAAARLDGRPSIGRIIGACRLLARIQREQQLALDDNDLAVVKAGYDALHGVLFGSAPASDDMARTSNGTAIVSTNVNKTAQVGG